MSRVARLLSPLVLLVPVLLTSSAGAYQDPAVGREEIAPPARGLLTLDDTEVARLRPEHREMREVLLGEQEILARLLDEYEAATGIREELLIQRRIGEVKQETECALLRIQAKHARLAGRDEVADHLEAVASSLESSFRPATGGDPR